ncbi:unnamed protein product, partial [Amoebophrya sp. A120]
SLFRRPESNLAASVHLASPSRLAYFAFGAGEHKSGSWGFSDVSPSFVARRTSLPTARRTSAALFLRPVARVPDPQVRPAMRPRHRTSPLPVQKPQRGPVAKMLPPSLRRSGEGRSPSKTLLW